ncbi:hypothetical protein KMZ14_02490 [Acinetobacter schindleri]|uniref:hypothetical protein n=1 Tax=Acinetobacter schindleri TaxID=108981 RepID=UPI0023606946|nr:hypothetical protein [Acinetobacter schindleri]WDE16454.1 hypothetical protein KMZ14_02490 [Acinetobacter schindleri]
MMLLEEIYKTTKAQHSEYFNLRIQRSLSWLRKAVELQVDYDFQFLSLWIGLNALYVQENEDSLNQQTLSQFLHLILSKDHEKRISQILLGRYEVTLHALLDNQYLTQHFWDYQHNKISQSDCREMLKQQKIEIQKAVEQQDIMKLLLEVFKCFTTLRQQILQGGVSYASAVCCKQMQESCSLFSALLNTFIYILLEHAAVMDSGKAYYPVVQVN